MQSNQIPPRFISFVQFDPFILHIVDVHYFRSRVFYAMPVIQRKRAIPSNSLWGIDHSHIPIKKASSDLQWRLSPVVYKELRDAMNTIRCNEAVVAHVQSWLQTGSFTTASDILQLFSCLRNLVDIMKYSFEKLIWPLVIYAERYVAKTGPIDRSELFPLLMVSTSVAMKMWEDCGPDLNLTAFACGISKRELSALGRVFLKTLGYKLFLDSATIAVFQTTPVFPRRQELFCFAPSYPCVAPSS
eukprot:TRINITY_DN19698_c0_g1_i1.p1 TRINITY_DN19698_c0_g1~~TRINITY_DN19698_c0_g1_i1.p1  ORF type:complete len:244 (-),score=6.81 TRINITY_DN19698_c0_g1_i1:281-1012(-)